MIITSIMLIIIFYTTNIYIVEIENYYNYTYYCKNDCSYYNL